MNLLVDTQIAVWWQIDARAVPSEARELIEAASGLVWVSRASLWELAIKIGIGKLKLDLPWFARRIGEDGFRWLDIRNEHLLAVATLPEFDDHKDPFDRLLVAQSQVEPLIFLTADRKLQRYGSFVRVV